MSEEEKEAIEIMLEDMFFWQGKSSFITRHRYKELSKKMYKEIEKLQKENEEYHRIKKDLIRVNKKIYDVDTIDEFIETIDKLQKVIDLMATELSRRPLMIYLDNERDDRLVILDNPKEIIKYYTKKAEE